MPQRVREIRSAWRLVSVCLEHWSQSELDMWASLDKMQGSDTQVIPKKPTRFSWVKPVGKKTAKNPH